MLPDAVHELIRMALAEDIGQGDVTAACFVPADRRAKAVIASRESGMLAGTETAAAVFAALDPDVLVTIHAADGTRLSPGTRVISLEGPARSILTGERTALNFLQRLSGIATQTRRCADALAGTATRMLDTRKTTPGWRWLEKSAVRAGGGTNHRSGLYDMVMVKDNHLMAAGDTAELQAGIDRVHALHPGMKIEIEADTPQQVERFLTLQGVDFILLDNMSLEDMTRCVAMARGSGVQLEASGGITMERLPAIAATGVDFISSGALTHSVRALDLGLDFLAE
jgi:nicotinate-nucleotide pyrophosphorylase (carboxylating)